MNIKTLCGDFWWKRNPKKAVKSYEMRMPLMDLRVFFDGDVEAWGAFLIVMVIKPAALPCC